MFLPDFWKKAALFAVLFCVSLFAGGCASQKTFSDPNQAVDAFVSSLRSNDPVQTRHILGLGGDEILLSGDPVEVHSSVEKFLAASDVKHELTPNQDGTLTLCVGDDNWPLPIPLAKKSQNSTWYFDTDAGKDELINRRIGRNELDTIQVCLAIVDAQHEYAESDPDHDGVPAYAQKFISDPGKKNGLYWETAEIEPSSPLGPFVATAESQGYSALTKASNGPQPYHGYFYRMIKAQGPDASGGRSRLQGRQLHARRICRRRHAPPSMGIQSVMTFIVNQDGVVYQQDLGHGPKPRQWPEKSRPSIPTPNGIAWNRTTRPPPPRQPAN